MARIYGLFHPSTGALFYIGRTLVPLYMRKQQHVDFARRKKSQCGRAQAIREILALGLRPEIGLIEEVPDEQSAEYEGIWIEYFRYIGCLLTNEQSHLVGGTRSHVLKLTEEQVQKLGKCSDSELALEWGVTPKAIAYHRKVRDIPRKPQIYSVIPAYLSQGRNAPLPREESPLSEKQIERLGKFSDSELALEWGVTRRWVGSQRERLGIPRKPQEKPIGGWNKFDLPQELIDQLGTMGDRRLGKIFGVSKEVVMRARQARDIPSYSERNGHPTRFQSGQGNWRMKKKDEERG